MEYYNPENREPLRWAAIAVLIYVTLLTGLMLTVRFSVAQTDPADEGILVEFGEGLEGEGLEELAATDVAATPPPTQREVQEEMIETDDRQEIAIEQLKEQNRNKNQEVAPEQPVNKPDTTVTEPRTVNQNALFPGRNEQSTATSQGASGGAGNAGDESGGQTGTQSGGGSGDDGIEASFSLKDRSIVGALPRPTYNNNATGKVVIYITVDDSGRVSSASYQAQGSTTNNSQLVAAARAAALKARFTASENFTQGGTITYIFKMN